MKKLILSAFVFLLAFKGYAADSNDFKQQDFETQAFELLVKNIDKIKLEGDISPNEKLKPILDDLGEFIGEHIFSGIFDDGDPGNYKGNIKSFSAHCEDPAARALSVKCEIFIEYKPIGETGIIFQVGLDKNKKPESILQNRVIISRGD